MQNSRNIREIIWYYLFNDTTKSDKKQVFFDIGVIYYIKNRTKNKKETTFEKYLLKFERSFLLYSGCSF